MAASRLAVRDLRARARAGSGSGLRGRAVRWAVESLEGRVLLSNTWLDLDCDCGATWPVPEATATSGPAASSAPPPVMTVEEPEHLAPASSADAFNATPTGWEWWNGADGAFLAGRVNLGNRIVDLEVETGTPTFTAALVSNTGSHAKEWYWVYNQTLAGLATQLVNQNLRLTDIEEYPVGGGQFRYAAIMIPNTGADAKQWWWYVNETAANLETYRIANNARIVDLDGWDAGGGQRRYAAIMIRNTGADAKAWWYYYGQTPAQIQSIIQSTNARVVDMEPVNASQFDVVLETGQGDGGGGITGTTPNRCWTVRSRTGRGSSMSPRTPTPSNGGTPP